jgi:hypothetical protein
MKHLLSILFGVLSFLTFAQKPDVVPIIDPELKPKLKKETNVIIKAGTTLNFINKELYKILNDGSYEYKPESSSFYINPCLSIGIERQFLKRFGFHFNFGFYQTLQKYTTSKEIQIPFNGTNISNSISYREGVHQYLHNNIFAELLPTYKYKHTRFLAGFNLTRSSPTVSAQITITNSSTGDVEVITAKDKPEESYHVYSMIGVIQGFPVKTIELTVSASYFGILKKYDSGFNLMFGVLF